MSVISPEAFQKKQRADVVNAIPKVGDYAVVRIVSVANGEVAAIDVDSPSGRVIETRGVEGPVARRLWRLVEMIRKAPEP